MPRDRALVEALHDGPEGLAPSTVRERYEFRIAQVSGGLVLQRNCRGRPMRLSIGPTRPPWFMETMANRDWLSSGQYSKSGGAGPARAFG